MWLGLILFCLTAFLLLPLALELRYSRLQSAGEAVIVFWIWKLPLKLRIAYLEKLGSYLYAKARVQVSEAGAEITPTFSLRRVWRLLRKPPRSMMLLARVFLFFLEEIEKLEVRLKYSTGEAAVTGIAAGAAWWLLAVALSFLNSRFVFLNKPRIKVTPVFGSEDFELYLHCIFRIRLGHIMIKRIKQQLN